MPRLCCSVSSALLASALLGCASPPPVSPASRLPSYGADEASALDDGFSGHLFETAFVTGVPGDDPHFEDRVRAAESIWLVKVATVSLEGSLGNNRRYGLTFRPLETLSGPRLSAPLFLTVSAKDPSFHWLDRVGGAWVGRELLLMTRHYRQGDAVVMHFHGEPNSPALRARITEIQARAGAERAAAAVEK